MDLSIYRPINLPAYQSLNYRSINLGICVSTILATECNHLAPHISVAGWWGGGGGGGVGGIPYEFPTHCRNIRLRIADPIATHRYPPYYKCARASAVRTPVL